MRGPQGEVAVVLDVEGGSVEEGEEESGDEEEEGSGEVVAAAEESHLGILAFWRGR